MSASLITQLYIGYYNRAPDPAGLSYWIEVAKTQSITQIAEFFSQQAESKAAYPYLNAPNVADPNAFVNQIYLNLFNRAATDADKAYWVGQLQSGKVSVGAFIATIQFSANSAGTGDDFNTLKNKATVGLDYATKLANANVNFTQDSAKDVISGVTKDAATVTAGTAKTDAFVAGGGGAAQTLILTTGADNLVGGLGNDTFNGTAAPTSGATLTASDTLDGGAGTDTLNVTFDNDAGAGTAVLPAANIKNIENFYFRVLDPTAALTVDFASISGEKQVWADRATQNVVSQNLATGTVVGVKGDGQATTVGTHTFTMATATDAINIVVDAGVKQAAGVGAIGYAASTATTATITSSGSANTVGGIQLGSKVTTLTINASADLTVTDGAGTAEIVGFDATATAATMNITGAGKVNVGLLDANLDVLAAGTATGAITAGINSVTQKITTGSGDDVISTGGTLTTGSVDAGGGTGDRLVVTGAHISSAADGAKYTNFEQLQVENGVSVNLDHISGITSIRINDGAGATGVTNLSAAQAGAITVLAGNAGGAITIGVKGATDVGQIDTVKITANDGATTTSTVDLGTVAMAGVEKLELTAVDDISVAALTAAPALDSIKIFGAGAVSITSGAIVPNANTVVDGSQATGVLTLNFGGVVGAANTNAMLITGGSKGDTITASGGAADVINGKDGLDVITVTKDGTSSGFATVQSEALVAANADIITGFVTGENKFDYNGALSNGTGVAPGISAAEVVTNAGTFANALADGAAGNAIVYIAQGNLGGAAGGTALDNLVAGFSAANATALVNTLIGTGGALNGAIANLDTVLSATDAVLLVLDNGTNSVALRITNTDTAVANTLTAAEVQVVAVYNATAQLAAGDFI